MWQISGACVPKKKKKKITYKANRIQRASVETGEFLYVSASL